jgi:hypothetical protein
MGLCLRKDFSWSRNGRDGSELRCGAECLLRARLFASVEPHAIALTSRHSLKQVVAAFIERAVKQRFADRRLLGALL